MTAEQGQITDRINKAVEGLGADKIVYVDGEQRTEPNLEVRLGAIFALERIAQDSLRDHIQIMEMLCAYVRENAPCANLEPTATVDEIIALPKPRMDIQTVITVIGRRSNEQRALEEKEKFRLDLQHCNLSKVSLAKGNFDAALFSYSRFELANFQNANLRGTRFFYTLLNWANFSQSQLKGADLYCAEMSRPAGNESSFSSPRDITFGNIVGVSIAGANATNIFHINKAHELYVTEDTQLERELMCDFNQLKKDKGVFIWRRSQESFVEWKNRIDAEIESNPYVLWSPYSSSDGMNGRLRQDFLEYHGLTGWPYDDS